MLPLEHGEVATTDTDNKWTHMDKLPLEHGEVATSEEHLCLDKLYASYRLSMVKLQPSVSSRVYPCLRRKDLLSTSNHAGTAGG